MTGDPLRPTIPRHGTPFDSESLPGTVKDRARLAGLILAELLVVVGLHALARLETFSIEWSDLSGWLSATPYDDAIGSVVLVMALVLAHWLLLSTLAYLAASLSGRSAAVGAVRWLTLPPIRRLVSRAAALSIAASALVSPLAPAVANLADGSGAEVVVEVDGEGRLHPPGMSEAPDEEPDPANIIVPPHLQVPSTPDPGDAAEESAPPPASVEGSVAHTVTVRRGDHLWSLSEHHLERAWNRTSLGEHQIARYWVQVIEANRATIRSGDPDLIYPGEVITLPPVPPQA